MTVREVIEYLDALPKDNECLIAIDRSAGFEDDHMEVYPIDRVFNVDILNTDPKADGYWYGEDGDKVLFYVYP